jgi:hypothetical protein
MTLPSDINTPEFNAFKALASETFTELAYLHQQLHPEKDISVFPAMFAEAFKNPSVSGLAVVEQFEAAQDAGGERPYLGASLVISNSYLAQAYQAANRGDAGNAWFALARACYWCGVMRSANNKLDFTLQGVEAIRNAEASIGGNARSRKYAPARAAIIELARELKPKRRGWESYDEIARAIEKKTKELGAQHPISEALSILKVKSMADYVGTTLKSQLQNEELQMLFSRTDPVAAK